MLQFYSLIHR